MIGGIIVLLIIYVCLIGAYWVYKREKTDISACGFGPYIATLLSVGSEMEKAVEAGTLVVDLTNSAEAAQAIMDYDPRFGVGGIYSMEWQVKFESEHEVGYTPTEEEGEQNLQTLMDNCVSVLKSRTKFKTNWLYFGDGF